MPNFLVTSTGKFLGFILHFNGVYQRLKKQCFQCAVALAVGAAACWFGWYSNDVVSILLLTYTVNSAGLFLPIICAFFWKRACSNAAFCSIVSAAIVIAVWYICGITTNIPLFKVSSLWPALIVSGTAFLLISLRHRQTEGELAKAERFIAIANKD